MPARHSENRDGEFRQSVAFYAGVFVGSVMLLFLTWFITDNGRTTLAGIVRLALGCIFGSLLAVGLLGTAIQVTANRAYHTICTRLGSRRWLLGVAGATTLLLVFCGSYLASWLLDEAILPALLGQADLRIETVVAIAIAIFLLCVGGIVRLGAMLSWYVSPKTCHRPDDE